MKRITLLLTAAFFCLSMSAQIQRKFFGITLGESKINEVEKVLKKNDISYEQEKDNIETSSVEFGGYVWHKVDFQFYENKLYSVVFCYRDYLGLSKSYINKRFESISKTLKDKYADFINNEEDQGIAFTDDVTTLNLKQGESFVVLGYVDKMIVSKKTEKEKNEF